MQTKKSNKTALIITLSTVALAVTILVSAVTWFMLSKVTLNDFDVFEYVFVEEQGVEGHAELYIAINTYSLEAQMSTTTDSETVKEYITALTFTADGVEVPVRTFDFDWEDESDFEDESLSFEQPEAPRFDWKNGDKVVVAIEENDALNKEFGLVPSKLSIDIEIKNLGKPITSIDQVTTKMLDTLRSDSTKYVSLGFDFTKNYSAAENAIMNGTAEYVGAYYRMDDYKPMTFESFSDNQPSSFTVAFAFKYDNKIYLVTKTGMYISPYSFGGDTLSYGQTLYHDDFDFTDEEMKPENITATMKARGYEQVPQA